MIKKEVLPKLIALEYEMIGLILKEKRLKLNLSITALAKKLNRSSTLVASIENGSRDANDGDLKKILTILMFDKKESEAIREVSKLYRLKKKVEREKFRVESTVFYTMEDHLEDYSRCLLHKVGILRPMNDLRMPLLHRMKMIKSKMNEAVEELHEMVRDLEVVGKGKDRQEDTA